MIPRYGEPVRGQTRYRRRPGAYAILVRGAEILLTHQAEPSPEHQLPGGGIDPGEPPITSLHREVMEETGWHVANLRYLRSYRRFTYMPEYDLWAEKLCHIFTGRPTLRISEPTEAGHTAVWTDLGTARRILASEGDRRVLSSFLRDRT